MTEMGFINQRTWNPEGEFKLVWKHYIASSVMFFQCQILYTSIVCFMWLWLSFVTELSSKRPSGFQRVTYVLTVQFGTLKTSSNRVYCPW